jgi:signal transduction histidine kinase
MKLRIDLVFSYWIFIWFLLYIFHYTNYNPKFALLIGVIDNTIMLCLMLYFGTKWKTIIYFLLINFFIKVIPIYFLQRERIRIKDILFTSVLFIIFIGWLHVNNESLQSNALLVYNSLIHSKNNTPLLQLMKQMENKFILTNISNDS